MLLVSGNLHAASADVVIIGGIDGLQVTADNSTLAEVLDALSTTVDLSYRKLDDLARPVSGTFEGPLPQVLARLLQGHDYVLRRTGGNAIEVLWVKTSARRPGGAAAPKQPDAPSPNAQANVYRPHAASRPPVVIQPTPPWRTFVAKASGKHVPDRSAKAYGVGKYRKR